jgi:uncharacterized protein (TIGR02118 family)
MIRVSVLYPNGEGKHFDHDYYADKHIAMIADTVGSAMVGCEIDKGVTGMPPGQPAPFVAAVHMKFNSESEFQQAFLPHLAKFLADIPNYTDIAPTVQISEVVS